jgi:formylglycine-generating enzyme required for sulfatase activity
VEEWRKARGNAEFPWGDAKSPPKGAGNYADETARATFGKNFPIIAGYHDGFATTSPVKTFTANALGLYDLGGNVQEWSADQDVASGEMLILGASWKDGLDTVALKNKPLYHEGTGSLRPFLGFRCVVSLPGD